MVNSCKYTAQGLIMKNIVIFLGLLFSFSAIAEDDPGTSDQSNETQIYQRLPTEISSKHADQNNVIRFYYSYTCPYCKQVHQFIKAWGNSLPNGYSYIETPVIDNSNASKMLASAIKYVENNSPSQYFVDRYNTNIYKNIHKISTTEQLSRLIKEAMGNSKVNYHDFLSSFEDEQFINSLEDDIEQQEDYSVHVTPTVVIGGKYVTHLGLAEGDTNRFIDILNAVSNLHIQSGGRIK
mgnify:CR=1 FL=1